MARCAALLLAAALAGCALLAQSDHYCTICRDHTMCLFQGLSRACSRNEGGGVSEEEKKVIVDTHNYFRNHVAGGRAKGLQGDLLPSAANMLKMYWDEELADVAQRWADQCSFGHDSCRDVDRFRVGQNVAMGFPYWQSVVKAWYDEAQNFSSRGIDTLKFTRETGHFTQVVWAETYLVGCGQRRWGQKTLYVCDYGPRGNWETLQVYQRGAPCSKCPEKATRCWEHLCAFPKKPGSSAPHLAPAPLAVFTTLLWSLTVSCV